MAITGDTLWKNTVVRFSGLAKHTPAAAAVSLRGNVLEMTASAEDAVLKPVDPGAWSHSLRAALAARVARQHELPKLAAHFESLIDDDYYKPITDPANDGTTLQIAHVVSFMDNVAINPRQVVAGDIQTLQQQGVDDADIVRLTELNAFLAYQLRLIAGLALISDTQS